MVENSIILYNNRNKIAIGNIIIFPLH